MLSQHSQSVRFHPAYVSPRAADRERLEAELRADLARSAALRERLATARVLESVDVQH